MKWLKGCMAALLVCMPAFVSAQECIVQDPSDKIGSDLSSPDGEYICRQAIGRITCYVAKEFEPGVEKQHAVKVYAYVCGNDGDAGMIKISFRNYSGFRIGNKTMFLQNGILLEQEAQELEATFKRIYHNLPKEVNIFFFDRYIKEAGKKDSERQLVILKGIYQYEQVGIGSTYADAMKRLVKNLMPDEVEVQQSTDSSP